MLEDEQTDCVVSGNAAHRSPYFNMVKETGGYVGLVIPPAGEVGRRQDAPPVYDLKHRGLGLEAPRPDGRRGPDAGTHQALPGAAGKGPGPGHRDGLSHPGDAAEKAPTGKARTRLMTAPYDHLPPLDDPATLFDLQGKVIFLAGGAGGMGRRFAATLAKAKAEVILADLNAEAARTLAAEIAEQTGGELLGLGLDSSSEDSVRAAFDAGRERFGRLDGLVYNVMAKPEGYYRPFEEYPLSAWQGVIQGNLTRRLSLLPRGRQKPGRPEFRLGDPDRQRIRAWWPRTKAFTKDPRPRATSTAARTRSPAPRPTPPARAASSPW